MVWIRYVMKYFWLRLWRSWSRSAICRWSFSISYFRESYSISKGQNKKFQSLENARSYSHVSHAIVVHGGLSSHMWCMQMTIFLILSWNTIIQKFYVVKLIQKIWFGFVLLLGVEELTKKKKQLFYSTTLWA